MTNIINDEENVDYASQLLGFLLNELGQIETAKSITIKDAEDDASDQGGRFAETLDDFENVEGKDMVFEDVQGPEEDGGINKPIKALEVRDERSAPVKEHGTPYALIWDKRRRCYVKRRKAIL